MSKLTALNSIKTMKLSAFVSVALNSLLLMTFLLSGCSSQPPSAIENGALTNSPGGAAGALGGEDINGDPEKSVEERAAEQKLIIERQRKEIERQKREIDELRRQRYYNERLKKYE